MARYQDRFARNIRLKQLGNDPKNHLLTSSNVYASMDLGTKNRQKQTAELCKQHLRQKYRDKLALVEEFIVEIEGPPQNCDLTRWGQFTDIKDIKKRDVPAPQDSIRELAQSVTGWLGPLELLSNIRSARKCCNFEGLI